MIDFLKGHIAEIHLTHIVLEVQGIGYRILVPTTLPHSLGSKEELCTIYTSFIVREDSHTLYGFLSQEERNIFDILRGATGIGPKTALAIMSHLKIEELFYAVQNKEDKIFARVPGIGKKGAQRLVIELQDKLAGIPLLVEMHKAAASPNQAKIQDAISALIHLGYNQATAKDAVKKALSLLPEEAELSALITASLKQV